MEDIRKDEKVITATNKLKKEKVEVSINPKMFLLKHFEEELKKLENTKSDNLNEDESKLLEQMKKSFKENIDKYTQAKLDAYMVPLKYNDLQMIKNGILEALKYTQSFNFDEDIRMKAMIREEHTLTVYLSLRKKEDMNKKYYDSLEDIAKEPESTIEELYNIYLENFVLTEEERKNL